MGHWPYTISAVALAGIGLLLTGWWRLAFSLFALRPDRMTVKQLALAVSAPADVERVDTILGSFAGGFNAMIVAPSSSGWQHYCDSLPALYRPFAHEGAAMGYTLRNLFRYRSGDFEERLVKRRPEFRYLYYVGLGFWSGQRNHDTDRLSRIVNGLDPLHGYLCYDGYGFKHAFFDYPKEPRRLRQLNTLNGYARNAAYQGVGRAFFFLFMARPDLLVEHIRRLGEFAVDAAAGVGLAAVFVNPDRLDEARQLGMKLPSEWHDHFHLGMCFGLKARAINDLDQFELDISPLDPRIREAVYASIRECDRVELIVRDEHDADGYRHWRERVTEWMADNIEYPLFGIKSSATTLPGEPRACARADTQPEQQAAARADVRG